ncbi:MAG TPA: farnesyl diphosphate synthase [Planctomycetota bacterium]|nr:farnesyl diphosphate synthase [Planctomycetota bacterium]
MTDGFDTTWKKLARRVDDALGRYLPARTASPRELHRAMRYSVFAGGKRLRPVLCLAAGRLSGGRVSTALPAACALEMVHTYSLIHDDLPAMDDDDFRRGKPTAHRKFGEALAILAGDALLTLAFETITRHTRDRATAARLCEELAVAAGTDGMVGGQVFDLLGEGKRPSRRRVEEIHKRKTAALIRASVRMGAIAARTPARDLRSLTRFGETVGLLFQITDDLLDETGDSRRMGKRVRKDAARGKQTYPRAFGFEKTCAVAKRTARTAEDALKRFGKRATFLREVPHFILTRGH